MHQQNTYQKPKEAQALQSKFNQMTRIHRSSGQETEPTRVSSKYERRNFYEKKMFHPDGPGGNYEGL